MTKRVTYPEGRKPAPGDFIAPPADTYDHPEDAPATVIAADGKTVLTGYCFEGVIYARSQEMARSWLRGTVMRSAVERASLTGPVEVPPHAEHTLEGPADCSRCQMLRDNQDWMEAR